MAIISDKTKIDKSFKFVSGKGYTTTDKGVDNEDASSGFIIGTSSIFSQDAAIPTTAPAASTSILTFYGDGTNMAYPRFKMVYDVSSPLNKAWYASTNGTNITTMRNTRVPNWVPPKFGNYTIRIFLTVGGSTTNPFLLEIFFSDPTSPLFDYKTGILTFESDPLAAYASYPGGPPDGIQISGYIYTGPLLSQIFDTNGNFTSGLSDIGTSTSSAIFTNSTKTFEISSPFAISTTWSSETTPYGTSSVNWHALSQFPNGEGIAVGIAGTASIVYSWGHGVWRKATTIPGGLSTLNQVWAGPDNITAYATDTSNHLIQTVDSGRNWSSLTALSFVGKGIWGSSLTDIFIVGISGNIVHSVNGTSFSAQTNADANDLFSIMGSSSSDIYAVGNGGTIRHSVGAGTWLGQTSGTVNNLYAVYVASPTEIYAGGAVGTLLKSTGGGSWSLFNSGISANLTIDAIWVNSSGNTKKIYISGPDSVANNYAVYVSSGSNAWTLETTFSGPVGQAFSIAGGTSGIFGGLDNGRIAVLHKNPVELIHGHTRYDGYLNVHGSIDARNADLNTLNLTTLQPTPSITILPNGTTNYTILSAVSADTGEGFRFWRESQSVYTLDVGSKVTTNNDGSTPYSAGGRIRLGGFTTSPSTTARGEIETVSSVGLKVAAYQGDLTIANLFGSNGVSKGDVNITTQNGAIIITANGAENPYPAGQILMTPGTNAYVLLQGNTSGFTFRTQSLSGNYNLMDGTGSFSNNGSMTVGTTLNVGTSATIGTFLSTSTYIKSGTGISTGGHTPVGNNIDGYGDINCMATGNIFCNGGTITAKAGNIIAQNDDSKIYIGNALTSGSPGSVHGGLHADNIPGGAAYYFTSWGLGFNPNSAARAGSCFYNTMAIFGASVPGLSSGTVYIDHSVVGGTALSTVPYAPGGFNTEFGWCIEWQTAAGTTGFTLFGRARFT